MLLSALPTDVLGIVHTFLSTTGKARYCRLHDPGAAFRCCAKLFSSAWGPPRGLFDACCSLHRIVYSKLQPACERNRRKTWVSGVLVRVPDETFRPRRLCALHDCTAEEWDEKSVSEQLEALRQLVKQIHVARRPSSGLTLVFSSWKALGRFTVLMKRAGLDLCSWTPYMTRGAPGGGIQVTWLRKSMCFGRVYR